MAKRASGIKLEHIVIVAVIALGLGFFPSIYPGFFAGEIRETTPAPTATTTEIVVTQQDGPLRTVAVSTTTLKPRVADVYAPGAPLDVECAVQENGTTVYDSDAIASENASLEPGSTYLLACWDDGQTTDLSAGSITLDSTYDWYGFMTYITMPVKSEVTFPGPDFESDFEGLYKEARPATHWVQNPNGEINATTQADQAANDQVTFTVTVQAPSKAAYGDPYAVDGGAWMQIALDYNLVGFDEIELQNAVYDGVTYSVEEASNYPDYNQDVFDVVYDIVGLSGLVNNKKLVMDLWTDFGSTAPTDGGCDWNVHLLDPALYYDGTEGHGFQYSVDDWEDNADIGQANYRITVNCQ